jgi:LPPG:FO 2-phospho-L-lactate transferase
LHGGAEPTLLQEAILAIQQADLVVIAPSNPWVSIDPILGLNGIREALKEKFIVAVSPIIQGKAIKGPAAKMFAELGIEPSSLAVLNHYEDLLDLFVYDASEKPMSISDIPEGIQTIQLQTIMTDEADKVQLTSAILEHYVTKIGAK